MTIRSWLPLLPLLAALSFAACGGGGCGGEPAPSNNASESKASSGKSSGGGSAEIGGGFDGGRGGGTISTAAAQGAVTANASAPAPASGPAARAGAVKGPRIDWLDPVRPLEWEAEVLHGRKPTLVMTAREGCANCALAGEALKMVSQKRPDISFRRLDPSEPEAPRLLPPGLTDVTPSFAFYEGGKAVTSRGGLPFPRSSNESDADYRLRLYRWFRDALTQRDLQFGHHTG